MWRPNEDEKWLGASKCALDLPTLPPVYFRVAAVYFDCVHCNACDSGGGYWRKRWRTGLMNVTVRCGRDKAARQLRWLRQHRAARLAGARAAQASWAARELHREHWRGLRLAEGWRLRARGGDGPARGPDARRGVRRARARAGGSVLESRVAHHSEPFIWGIQEGLLS
eukprot:scaffold42054_cov63-Phaeocystis_antarctica.AAC.3